MHRKFYFSLVKDTLPNSFDSALTPLYHHSESAHCALWLQSGSLAINDKMVAVGSGAYLGDSGNIKTHDSHTTSILRFIVSKKPLSILNTKTSDAYLSEIVFSQSCDVSGRTLLRLDQVDFPPAAVAYKHTHPGPGIRYLIEGGLTLLSHHGTQTMGKGEAWFEEKNSAVTATAIDTGPSQFVRAMLLPVEYKGRSTFTLHDQADANKPTLQCNTRHFEKELHL